MAHRPAHDREGEAPEQRDTVQPLVAAITLPGTMVARTASTINLTGLPISAPAVLTVTPPGGGNQVITVTADGSGNASATVVFGTDGPVSASVTAHPSTLTTLATANGRVSGH